MGPPRDPGVEKEVALEKVRGPPDKNPDGLPVPSEGVPNVKPPPELWVSLSPLPALLELPVCRVVDGGLYVVLGGATPGFGVIQATQDTASF